MKIINYRKLFQNKKITRKKIFFFFMLLFLISILFFNLLIGQKKLTEAELNEQIAQIEKDIQEEQKFFQEFLKQQNATIKGKQLEKKSLANEVRKRTADLREVSQKIFQVETQIQEINSFNKEIKDYFLIFTKDLKEKILIGIPLEREKRAAILSTLITDLRNNVISVNEAFSRIDNFLTSEIALGYDSQNIKVIEKVNGIDREFELLRIGRIFFALIDGDEVVLWEKNNNGEYFINIEKKIPFSEIRTIKNIADMLQGRKAPEISEVPFNVKSLLEK